MRKIEQQMLNAVRARHPRNLGNTTVIPCGDKVGVFLHGNHIANVLNDDTVEVNKETLALWSTNTTKSRLRALGAHVTTRKGVTYLDNVAV